MSLFSWFSRKSAPPPPKTSMPFESSGLGHVDATVPFMPSGKTPTKDAPHVASASPANRKTERLERRELLYSVVRESMMRAGVLSASFKFKVLSLDPRGFQYLIMMDLVNRSAGEAGRMAEIESLIAQSAKAKHGIQVTAVYWRIHEHVTTGLSPQRAPQSATAPSAPAAPPLPRRTSPAAVPTRHVDPNEPLQDDEVAAFKSALARASKGTALVGSGEIVQSRRRNPAPEPDFQNTELTNFEERRTSPLSGTQYGDLI